MGEAVDEVGDRAAVPAHVEDDAGAGVGQGEGEGEGAFGGEGSVFDDLWGEAIMSTLVLRESILCSGPAARRGEETRSVKHV